MCPELFLGEDPCGSILVSDNSVFVFWVASYWRFDCTVKKYSLYKLNTALSYSNILD